jgi:uncharacterized phage protein gp47/JayE
MTFGLTAQGFKAKRLVDIQTDLENQLLAEFGDINLDPQSIFGQQIGVFSKVLADLWENMEDVYFSQYPNSAEGISLDNVVQFNGITRLAAQQTRVTGVCVGLEGTLINQGALARIPDTGAVFFARENTIITRTQAAAATLQVIALAAQPYTALINNQAFSYSLPVITFTGSFVASNSIVVTLNGVALGAVPFTTNSALTNAAIAAMIATSPAVFSVGTPAGNIITIIPNAGFNVIINSIVITGGVSQPTYAITYQIPGSNNLLTAALTSVINAGTQPVTAIDNMDGTITVNADDTDVPFSIAVGTNLNITAQATPVVFLSQDFGPIVAPINTLTEILTPISGWISINNPKAGLTGRLIETDAELRIRRNNSLRLLGAGTVESIRARLLQQVPGVTSAFVFENRDLTQEPILIVLNQDLVSGNTIVVVLNGTTLPTVTFAVSHLATMNVIAALIQNQPEVVTATVGGTANRTITMNMASAIEVIMIPNDFTVSGGASQATAVIKGGRFPKSFEAVVQGGTDADVANKIWTTKPAGIQTFGNTAFTITDSQGEFQVINFSRPTPIYIWVTVALTLYAEEVFPPNGQDLVAAAINTYGSNLGIGVDVLLQRVLAQIFNVPGIASGVMQIASTNLPGDSPLFGTADISIAENEVAIFDLTRITVTV